MLEDLSQGGYGFDGGDDMDFMWSLLPLVNVGVVLW